MKNKLIDCFLLLTVLLNGKCFAQKDNSNEIEVKKTTIDLTSLSSFKRSSKNWLIAKDAVVKGVQQKEFSFTKGKGVLVNNPIRKDNKNLVTNLQHGNIEIEMEVLMPVGAKSGIFLQGRYEVQLASSWCKKELTLQDIGSINKGNQISNKGTVVKKNGARSPKLWQHLKIVFQAPKFNASGEKVSNAVFEKVVLNNIEVVKNAEVSGPTIGSVYKDEKELGPIVLQSGEGAMAFRNIKYKLNKYESLQPQNIVSEIKPSKNIKDLAFINSLKTIKKKTVSTISPLTDLKKNAKNIIVYSGKLVIPETGNYVFTMAVQGGAFLALNNKVIHNFNMSVSGHESKEVYPKQKKCYLKKGEIPFVIAYNKNSPRRRFIELLVEGDYLQKHSLLTHKFSKKEQRVIDMNFVSIEKKEKTIVQRSFLMYKGIKRTHCISVGYPQGANYSYDLATGSLLQIWNGSFLNTTYMWYGRGNGQMAYPKEFATCFHGDVDFAFIKNEKSTWPKEVPEGIELEQKGYRLDKLKNPTFYREIQGAKIADKFVPSTNELERKLTRKITIESKKAIWHKVIAATNIEVLPDGTYLVLNQNVLIDFSNHKKLKPIVRSKDGIQELIVKIPTGKQQIEYDIIW